VRNLDRRTLLRAVALSVLAATARPASVAVADTGPADPPGRASGTAGVLTRLPGSGNQLALTIDDGTNTAVVATLAQFCRDSGVRLTFFPNGVNPSWTVNAGLLRPMVDSGQIQLGNHTWSHPKLTQLPKSAVAEQIQRNADFLRNTYGTDGAPYFRPPYGLRNAQTDNIAADLGYTTIALWSATIGDSRPENEQQLLRNANAAFQPQQIILGHANLLPISHTYAQILDIIHSRGLQTVTLADAFS
jgi:peptidoglycan/xylan/chitin deacetylase (PgdA/CDA1 family)